jgi:hypothetical protein
MAIDEYEGIQLPFEVEDEIEAANVVDEMLRDEGLDDDALAAATWSQSDDEDEEDEDSDEERDEFDT